MTLSNRTKRVLAWIILASIAALVLGIVHEIFSDWMAVVTLFVGIVAIFSVLNVVAICAIWLYKNGFFKDRKDE